jgi:hypothetical protein
MKIILSRKGFDSAHGGIASPVFPEREMLSFPIPGTDDKKDPDNKQSVDRKKPRKDNIEYRNLQFVSKNSDGTGYEEISLDTILKDLGYYNQKKYSEYCHLDPDLVEGRRKDKVEGWTAAFGQINQSAKYLQNQQIGEGDLFLFFGNFHHVEMKDGKFCYVRSSENNKDDFYGSTFQAIWGYMQVGKVLTDPKDIMKYKWHPHACRLRNDGSGGDKNNTLYLPTQTLSFRPDLPGYGVFDYDEKRVLTKKGCTKAVWDYTDALVVENRKNRAKEKGGIYYPGIWQELILESKNAQEWAKNLF